jgi:hypothetical protein
MKMHKDYGIVIQPDHKVLPRCKYTYNIILFIP